MDLHQRIDSIKTIASALVVSDPTKVAFAFQKVTKEIVISEFLIIVPYSSSGVGLVNTIL